MTIRFGRSLAVLASAAALAGCVTINIYFPEAAAERAADRIIEDVWQLRKGAGEQPVKPAPPAQTQ